MSVGLRTRDSQLKTARTVRREPGSESQTRVGKSLPLLLRTMFVLLLLGLWQIASTNGSVSPLILPAPEAVVQSLFSGLVGGLWVKDILSTLLTTCLGFAFGVLGALIVGITFSFSALTRQVFYPVVLVLQTFPKVAIAPLLVVWLGYGPEPKILIAALLAFFPVLTAAIAGFTEVDSDELKLMASMQATKLQELGRLRIPNAMSYVFPALDVAVVSALIGTIVGELVGSADGIGHLLTGYSTLGQTASIYALLVFLALIGWTLHAVIGLAYRFLPNSIVPKRPAGY